MSACDPMTDVELADLRDLYGRGGYAAGGELTERLLATVDTLRASRDGLAALLRESLEQLADDEASFPRSQYRQRARIQDVMARIRAALEGK